MTDSIDQERIEDAVRAILSAVGEDPEREGLQETPSRVARAYKELFGGLGRDPADEVNVFFEMHHDEMVAVRDIPFYSMCEHHLLPFTGRGHIVYLPKDGRITGLSKLARALEVAARRPQIQERLTSQVATALMDKLQPHGVLVVVEAEHLCMTMRGVQKPGSTTTTSAIRGTFRHDDASRAEAMDLLGRTP